MSEYEKVVSKIRQMARDRAGHELDQRERHLEIKIGMVKASPKFSTEDRESYLREAEEDAIYRLHMHFVDVALQ